MKERVVQIGDKVKISQSGIEMAKEYKCKIKNKYSYLYKSSYIVTKIIDGYWESGSWTEESVMLDESISTSVSFIRYLTKEELRDEKINNVISCLVS